MRLVIIGTLLVSFSTGAVDVSQLTWLSGCWAYDGKESGSGEYWTAPAAGTMLAVSRTIRDSETAGFEFLRIAETDSHSLTLFASPSGQPPTAFDMISLTDREVTFENPDHDFPQRIVYRLGENATLLGRIEGQSDGQLVVVSFPMTRIDCNEFGR